MTAFEPFRPFGGICQNRVGGKKLAELQAARAKALAAWKALITTAETATCDLNDDEQKRVADFEKQVKTLDEQIAMRQRLDAAERAAPAIVEKGGDGDFAERARREFRITLAIAAQVDHTIDAGLEREFSQETVKRTGPGLSGTCDFGRGPPAAAATDPHDDRRRWCAGSDPASSRPLHRSPAPRHYPAGVGRDCLGRPGRR